MTNRILKLHGCSGAGKTTIVRKLMEASDKVRGVRDEKDKIQFYQYSHPIIDVPIFILGSYENICGGLDTITSAQTVLDLIDALHPKGHIIMEGLLSSTYYGQMGIHSEQFGDDYIYAFLDTPVEECLRRVEARRLAANNTRPFNPQLTIDKWNTIAALQKKLRGWGRRVEEISWREEHPEQLLLNWMRTLST